MKTGTEGGVTSYRSTGGVRPDSALALPTAFEAVTSTDTDAPTSAAARV